MKWYVTCTYLMSVAAGAVQGQALIRMAPIDVAPEFRATIPYERYLMSVTEVTNEQFATVINASDRFRVHEHDVYHPDAGYFLSLTPGTTYFQFGLAQREGLLVSRPGKEDHPAAGMSWMGAVIFANELSLQEGLEPVYTIIDYEPRVADSTKNGYRLPTEAEWEYAANGGDRSLRYPWGDVLDGSYANYFDSGDPYEEAHPFARGIGPTTPMGWYNGEVQDGFVTNDNRSVFGIFDLIGNVSEWMWVDEDTRQLKPLLGGSFSSSAPLRPITNINEFETAVSPLIARNLTGGSPSYAGIRLVRTVR